MKKFKWFKSVLFSLIAATVFSAFGGCGGESQVEKENTMPAMDKETYFYGS